MINFLIGWFVLCYADKSGDWGIFVLLIWAIWVFGG